MKKNIEYQTWVKLRSQNHQYSDRRARPLKVTYFWKHVLTDSPKDIIGVGINSLFIIVVKRLKMNNY